jgi:ribosome maturation factor RimP
MNLTESVPEETRQIIQNLIAKTDIYLVDLVVSIQGKRTFIKVIVATDDGITLQEITRLTKRINDDPIIDRLFPDGYQLQVTSPGLDYPLKTSRDFYRNRNHQVKVVHTVEGLQSPIDGTIKVVGETAVTLSLKNAEELVLPLDKIESGRLILKW